MRWKDIRPCMLTRHTFLKNQPQNLDSPLNLLLNPAKTQEMVFSTPHVKSCTPDLVLNDTIIVFI